MKLRYLYPHITGNIVSLSKDAQRRLEWLERRPEKAKSEYLLNFHRRCQGLGITHYFTDPQCPKQNGRVERFIQTAVYEFFNWQEDLLDELEMIQKKCQEFNFKYNYQRFHHMLGYKTPMENLEDTEYVSISIESDRSKVYGI